MPILPLYMHTREGIFSQPKKRGFIPFLPLYTRLWREYFPNIKKEFYPDFLTIYTRALLNFFPRYKKGALCHFSNYNACVTRVFPQGKKRILSQGIKRFIPILKLYTSNVRGNGVGTVGTKARFISIPILEL